MTATRWVGWTVVRVVGGALWFVALVLALAYIQAILAVL